MRVCCGPSNKGPAVAGDNIFMATLDARVVALDRKTGKVVWNVEMDKYSDGFSATVAPLVVRQNLIVGVAGGENGERGYIDYYDMYFIPEDQCVLNQFGYENDTYVNYIINNTANYVSIM